MDTLYVESSIVSYLRQRPSSDLIRAARQVLTHRWWNNERTKYELVVSQYVIDEISAGAPSLATDRLRALDGIPILPPAPEIPQIAAAIVSRAILPPKAQVDCLAHRGRGSPSHTILVDVELHAHRQRQDAAAAPQRPKRTGNPHSDHLYARGVAW
jgi:hypothetical protein